MIVFAVFTMHDLDSAAWIEAGCAPVRIDQSRPSIVMDAEQIGDRLAVLRTTYGAALGNMARAEAAALGGIVLKVDCPTGWAGEGTCYDELCKVLAELS
jgi:hypothetical protein